MSTTITKPVAVLAQTEQSLCTAITALADRVDQIGTLSTADALTRLAESIEAAKCRLSQTYAAVQRMTADLVEDMEMLADDLLGDLAVNDLPLPAPAAAPNQNGHAENVRVEKPSVEPSPTTEAEATVEGEEPIHLTCPIPPLPAPVEIGGEHDWESTPVNYPVPPLSEPVAAVAANGAVEVPVPAKKKAAATTRRKRS